MYKILDEGNGGIIMQLPFHHLANALSEVTHLLAQSIVIPGRNGNLSTPAEPKEVVTSSQVETLRRQATGRLVLFAGGSLKDRWIVDLIHQAGGRECPIAIVPLTQLDHLRAGERYQRMFHRFGALSTQVIDLATENALQFLRDSQMILFAGDGQKLAHLSQEAHNTLAALLRQFWLEGRTLAGFGRVSSWLADTVLQDIGIETESSCTLAQFLQQLSKERSVAHRRRFLYLEYGTLILIRQVASGYECSLPEGRALDILHAETGEGTFSIRPIFSSEDKTYFVRTMKHAS